MLNKQQNQSIWSGSVYEGDMKDGWYHGKGKFKYPNGVIYEGDFVKGQFHGEGILIYPNGGKYKAHWEHGKMIKGDYYFQDNLKYESGQWNYCQGEDRRFYPEMLNGIKPAGATQMTKEEKAPHDIPEGTYDVGEGYYEPIKSIIYEYDGKILRTPSEAEVENILKKCRYNPRKSLVITGENDKIIKSVTDPSKSNKI
ncbi:hypothetical protein ABPG72_000651 [Tetrahymena utriculariae]